MFNAYNIRSLSIDEFFDSLFGVAPLQAFHSIRRSFYYLIRSSQAFATVQCTPFYHHYYASSTWSRLFKFPAYQSLAGASSGDVYSFNFPFNFAGFTGWFLLEQVRRFYVINFINALSCDRDSVGELILLIFLVKNIKMEFSRRWKNYTRKGIAHRFILFYFAPSSTHSNILTNHSSEATTLAT